MPTLQFKTAVGYYGKAQYTIEVDDFRVDEVGVIFAGSAQAPDGSFILTVVPISNVVAMSRSVLPPPEDETNLDEGGPDGAIIDRGNA